MKKIKIGLIILIILLFISNISLAHGGNITGWKDKNSPYITKYNEKYYGYHKESGEKHYHQVKWNEEEQRWSIIAPAIYYDENFNKIENNEDVNSKKIEVKLVSVVDGDTAKFIIDEKTVTVRFLGINTKETVDPEIGEEAWGKEASNYTKEKLQNATKIELEFDNNADEKDKYGRYLAWIWIDDALLQNMLIEQGLAETYMLQNNYKYAGVLQESEEIAKNNKLGIWSDEKNSNIESKKTDSEIENDSINNLVYLPIGIIVMLLFYVVQIISQSKKKSK